MRMILIGVIVYAAIYGGVRTAYGVPPEDGGPVTVQYPTDMIWLYALMWPAQQVDFYLTGAASEMQEQRNIRDVLP
jgi:hypothetical protein